MGLLGSDVPSPEEQREANEANQDHASNLQFADDGEMDAGYIDKVTNSQLEQGTVDVLANLLSKDFVLGNLSEAELHEHRWLTREIVMEAEAEHPTAESMWQGRFRQVAAGRERDALVPLDGAQKAVMQQFTQGVITRATRSRDGWQQEEVNKSYRVSERREPDKDDGGFL
jgi:hypothetical protein